MRHADAAVVKLLVAHVEQGNGMRASCCQLGDSWRLLILAGGWEGISSDFLAGRGSATNLHGFSESSAESDPALYVTTHGSPASGQRAGTRSAGLRRLIVHALQTRIGCGRVRLLMCGGGVGRVPRRAEGAVVPVEDAAAAGRGRRRVTARWRRRQHRPADRAVRHMQLGPPSGAVAYAVLYSSDRHD